MSLRSAINIIRKDWFEQKKLILLGTAGMFVPLMFAGNRTDFAKGMMAGILVGASYSYSHFCFFVERQSGTLQLLLGLPVRPVDVVLSKYLSLYSMALFTANIPGIFLRDLRALFLVNALIVFLSSACMACTVVSAKPWAPMLPFWFALVFLMPIQNLLTKFYPNGLGLYAFVTSHIMWVALGAFISGPMIAFLSALHFARKCTV